MNHSRTDAVPPRAALIPNEVWSKLGLSVNEVGIVIVDHGSRRSESNELLLQVVDAFAHDTGWPIVEPAHMELAEPSIETAFDRAVQRGARFVIVHPYFLAPGRHWRQDIPQLTAQAAERHPQVRYLVTAPLGLHPLIQQVMQDRIWRGLQDAMMGDEA